MKSIILFFGVYTEPLSSRIGNLRLMPTAADQRPPNLIEG